MGRAYLSRDRTASLKSLRCASATKTVRPLRSTVATQPQLQPPLWIVDHLPCRFAQCKLGAHVLDLIGLVLDTPSSLVIGKALYDIAHAPADHSNRRRTPKYYAVWEIHLWFQHAGTQRNIDYVFLFLRKPIAAPATARRINKITGCGRVRLAG